MKKRLLPVTLLVLALVLTACFGGGSGGSSQTLTLTITAPAKVEVGQTIKLTANVGGTEANNATVGWASEHGTFSNQAARSVDWTAPASAGNYSIEATATAGSTSKIATVTINVVTNGGGSGAIIDAEDFLIPGAQWVYQHESHDSDDGKTTITLTVEIESGGPGVIIRETLEFTSEAPPVQAVVDDNNDLDDDEGTDVKVVLTTFAKVSNGELLIERADSQTFSGPDQILVEESHMEFTPNPKVELLFLAPGTSREAQWRQQGEFTRYGPVADPNEPDGFKWEKLFTIQDDADVTAKLEVVSTAADGVHVPAGAFPDALRVDQKWTLTLERVGEEPETFADEASTWYDPHVGLVRTTITSAQYQGVELGDGGPLHLELISYSLP